MKQETEPGVQVRVCAVLAAGRGRNSTRFLQQGDSNEQAESEGRDDCDEPSR